MYKTVQITCFTKVFYVTAFGFVGCTLLWVAITWSKPHPSWCPFPAFKDFLSCCALHLLWLFQKCWTAFTPKYHEAYLQVSTCSRAFPVCRGPIVSIDWLHNHQWVWRVEDFTAIFSIPLQNTVYKLYIIQTDEKLAMPASTCVDHLHAPNLVVSAALTTVRMVSNTKLCCVSQLIAVKWPQNLLAPYCSNEWLNYKLDKLPLYRHHNCWWAQQQNLFFGYNLIHNPRKASVAAVALGVQVPIVVSVATWRQWQQEDHNMIMFLSLPCVQCLLFAY